MDIKTGVGGTMPAAGMFASAIRVCMCMCIYVCVGYCCVMSACAAVGV